jgi:hypothetical protein
LRKWGSLLDSQPNSKSVPELAFGVFAEASFGLQSFEVPVDVLEHVLGPDLNTFNNKLYLRWSTHHYAFC